MTAARHRLIRAGRDLSAAAAGVVVGAAAVFVASRYGANRLLATGAVVLALLTAASTLDCIAERLRHRSRPAPPPPTQTRTAEPTHDQVIPSCGVTPTERTPAGGWVEVADLSAPQRVRELQCGACASYDVRPAPTGDGSIECRRCGDRTDLDLRGTPHEIRVRSRPVRGDQQLVHARLETNPKHATRLDTPEVPR